MESKKQISIHFCDFGTMDGIKDKFIAILKQRYSVVLDSTNPQYLFYSVFGGEHIKYSCVKIFYTGENIVPDFNISDYAIGFTIMCYKERYLRYPLYLFYDEDYKRAVNKHKNISPNILESKRRFCNFIVSNGGANPLRREAFEALSAYKRVDSAGKFLNNVGYAVEDKFAFQSECKFSIAFENSSTSGYLTEKLIQAVASKTIPIYWGDKSAFGALEANGGGLNEKAVLFIENKADFKRIIDEVKRLDSDDEAYIAKLKEPLFLDSNHKEIFDKQLADFLYNIFDKENAFMRSFSQIEQSREKIYKLSMKQYDLYMKTKRILGILKRSVLPKKQSKS